ncbi:MAG: aminodeoxychorismate synthase component I [Victivallales bacterium]|nr:aminodeoxychorismate synthase component I [Victivallales bacterium]
MIYGQLNTAGTVICRLPDSPSSELYVFTEPDDIIRVEQIQDIFPALEKIEQETLNGKFAAGFISYEAAPAFDPTYQVHSNKDFPLLYFGLYSHKPQILQSIELNGSSPPLPPPVPKANSKNYTETIAAIHEHIRNGDIYQVNYTIRTYCENTGADPLTLFMKLCQSHPVPYPAFVNTGDTQIVSISPELFLLRKGNMLASSPMKGTVRREALYEDDLKAAEFLKHDPKNTAENLMITDMVRNDFGKVCIPGSIHVDPLFQVDTYRTVHQMISTVHGQVPAGTGISEILRATFPAASITGAPKIRAMEIIHNLEDKPRKIYTGSIGCVTPGGDLCFNVAIRTLIFSTGAIELSVGGGIVHDSNAKSEWDECLLKSRFCNYRHEDFDILETMLYREPHGLVMLTEHLSRARNSQLYFGRIWNEEAVEQTLRELKQQSPCARVRMTINASGVPSITCTPLNKTGWNSSPAKICLSSERTRSDDIFLYHKTTRRKLYDDCFNDAVHHGFDEIIFLNERGELTEGAISNIFIKQNGRWFTPALKCGVLPGTMRKKIMTDIAAEEKILYLKDLNDAEELYICNSVRGGTLAIFIH